jgi:antitoxin component YwqK of YwqJK toxin-antitoxin module
MFRAIHIGLFLSGLLSLQGQNLVDEAGRKTGHWKVEYPNEITRYEGEFVEGRPVGEMLRYYETGALRARMEFDSELDRSYARLFYKNGKPAADGWYLKQIKDSIWTYYSASDGSVKIREPYSNGKLEGMVRNYYNSGGISEEVSWMHDMKEGEWKQYYIGGVPRLSGHHKDGMLHGSYEIYHANGSIKIRGAYLENKSDGTWYFYDETGKEVYALEYRNGTPVDLEKYEQWITDSLKKYEMITEPESFQ